jgi:hypothetical protein
VRRGAKRGEERRESRSASLLASLPREERSCWLLSALSSLLSPLCSLLSLQAGLLVARLVARLELGYRLVARLPCHMSHVTSHVTSLGMSPMSPCHHVTMRPTTKPRQSLPLSVATWRGRRCCRHRERGGGDIAREALATCSRSDARERAAAPRRVRSVLFPSASPSLCCDQGRGV